MKSLDESNTRGSNVAAAKARALKGRIAVVAGGSRGAGRGIALALGDAGAMVYVAGRTSAGGPRPADGAPGSVEETADAVTARGGVGIPAPTDCTDDDQVAALFDRVVRDHGRVDVLANAVWGAADSNLSMDDWLASWGKPFWEQPTSAWRQMMDAGPRAYFLLSVHAIRSMAARGGLIVGVTDGYFEAPAGKEPPSPFGHGQMVWTLSHLCINLLMQGIAAEAKRKKIAAVTLMPGFMRTERVVRFVSTDKLKKQFGFEHSESTEYLGRAVASLAADARVMSKSGRVHFVADLAREYGFTDVDGRQVPRFNPFAVTS